VDVNIFGILLFPGISGAPDYRNAVLAHVVSVLAGALFMALAAAAIQGILIACLSGKMFRRVSAALQALLMALLVMTLFLHPLIVSHLRTLVERSSPALMWFPPFCFLGLYEWMYPAGPTPVALGDLSLRAIQALAIASRGIGGIRGGRPTASKRIRRVRVDSGRQQARCSTARS
jgi:hypothetical protein